MVVKSEIRKAVITYTFLRKRSLVIELKNKFRIVINKDTPGAISSPARFTNCDSPIARP